MKLDICTIVGPWKVGYSLASHTLSADFLGYNEQGYPKFDTVRSEIGEQLYLLKYQGDTTAVEKLSMVAANFVREKHWPVEVVVPLPPSKKRTIQPVAAIAERVAKLLEISYDPTALRKTKETPELKSLTELNDRRKALAGAFASSQAVKGRNVLLFDDLYRSGASMEEAAQSLIGTGLAKGVYALALTRTRKNR